jgi:hypothetical protein
MKRARAGGVVATVLVGLCWIATSALAAEKAAMDTASDPDISNDGRFTFSLPIDAPVGTGSFAPSLSLDYESSQADGPFGVGWSLTTGEIQRSSRFGVPTYTTSDPFELSGQLLVYNGNASDPAYHTRRESFSKARRYGTGATSSWEVVGPDGTRRRYGCTADSRVGKASGSDPVFRWLLCELEDVHGNVIKFTYDMRDEGTRYPAAITYSYRAGALVGGVERKIAFVLEARPDVSVSYRGGVRSLLAHRVREIVSTVRIGSGTPQAFRRRVLTYAGGGYDNARSRIASTQLFGSDDVTALPARSFSYRTAAAIGTAISAQWEAAGWNIPVKFIDTDDGEDNGVRMGDVNGDGLPDLVRAHFKWDPNPNAPGPLLQVGAYHEVYLGTGTGWGPKDAAWSAALSGLRFGSPWLVVRLADNPDPYGKHAICARAGNQLQEVVQRPIYFTDEKPWAKMGWHTNQPTDKKGWIEAPIQAQLVDVDGDGLVDIVLSYDIGAGEFSDSGCGWDPNPAVLNPHAWQKVRVVFRNTASADVQIRPTVDT